MKRFRLLLLLSLLSAVSIGAYLYPTAQTKAYTAASNKPIAVVELFTSQGCSSCPSADRVLTELVANAKEDKRDIFLLSFHVAYWNSLGWTDPFSHEDYSNRQRAYAKALNTNVYTPQMVFNGIQECVGSSRSAVEERLDRVLKTVATSSIKLKATAGDAKAAVSFTIEGPWENQVLNLALVERNLDVAVNRGENRGRKLHHDNVVRSFVTLNMTDSKGQATLTLPEGVDLKQSSVIAYLQHPTTLAITGATQMKL